jgi:anthraniloyl-CoA monooxygenase
MDSSLKLTRNNWREQNPYSVHSGGLAGLYFAISINLRDPSTEVTVFKRNRANDTFGWGVILSDETLDNLAYWDDVATIHSGRKELSTGHAFCGIGRKAMLLILQGCAIELGVDLRFETAVVQASDCMDDVDVVVAAESIAICQDIFRGRLGGQPLMTNANHIRGSAWL